MQVIQSNGVLVANPRENLDISLYQRYRAFIPTFLSRWFLCVNRHACSSEEVIQARFQREGSKKPRYETGLYCNRKKKTFGSMSLSSFHTAYLRLAIQMPVITLRERGSSYSSTTNLPLEQRYYSDRYNLLALMLRRDSLSAKDEALFRAGGEDSWFLLSPFTIKGLAGFCPSKSMAFNR